jgi:hypothetical protein
MDGIGGACREVRAQTVKESNHETFTIDGGLTMRIARLLTAEGISFVTPNKDLVSLQELANGPFFNDIGKWHEELSSLPGRFKVAAVAYHSDGETYHYAPVLSDTDDIAAFASTCDEMFGEAYRKFVTAIPDIKPNVMFTALWVEET